MSLDEETIKQIVEHLKKTKLFVEEEKKDEEEEKQEEEEVPAPKKGVVPKKAKK